MIYDLQVPQWIARLPLVRPKKALALCDPPSGSVLLLTEALARGIARRGCSIDILPMSEWEPGQMADRQLLVVGAMDQDYGLSEAVRQFLDRTAEGSMNGKHGFAFDVRGTKRVLGSIGSMLEKRMEKCGMWIVMEHAYAVLDKKKGLLQANAEDRFEDMGEALATRVW
jgi:hypothetical protein